MRSKIILIILIAFNSIACGVLENAITEAIQSIQKVSKKMDLNDIAILKKTKSSHTLRRHGPDLDDDFLKKRLDYKQSDKIRVSMSSKFSSKSAVIESLNQFPEGLANLFKTSPNIKNKIEHMLKNPDLDIVHEITLPIKSKKALGYGFKRGANGPEKVANLRKVRYQLKRAPDGTIAIDSMFPVP